MFEEDEEHLWVVQDKDARFFSNLWFFPARLSLKSESKKQSRAAKFSERTTPGLDLFLETSRLLERQKYPKTFRHSITHHRIEGMVEKVLIKGINGNKKKERASLEKELAKLGKQCNVSWKRISADSLEDVVISSITPKILRIMGAGLKRN